MQVHKKTLAAEAGNPGMDKQSHPITFSGMQLPIHARATRLRPQGRHMS